ncbi:MAG TPA: hypothetical protein VNO23_08420, partial [Candidatus Binatia bacterium]|nr:hypothetical protein [Candidatus Binatia bacterium]
MRQRHSRSAAGLIPPALLVAAGLTALLLAALPESGTRAERDAAAVLAEVAGQADEVTLRRATAE